jgi:uncharacterized protein YndB with AHSA1/START domain
MKSSLFMDFSVDKGKNQINVTREFAASLKHVWAAWTEKELLDQWWAPKPWKAKTKVRDFKEGGYWLYAMVGPEGEEHWARADFKSIHPQKKIELQDAFCDSDGKMNMDFPRTKWKIAFSETATGTTVEVELTYEKLEDLEMIISMGFKEGFTMALENLDGVLAAQK